MKRISILVILGLLVWAGIYLRFIDLGQKPMHTDEAVNGVMVIQTLAGEDVHFDPGHYHGPLLRYLAIPVVSVARLITGAEVSESSLRWLTALAGGLTVLVIGLFRKHLGKDASFIALVFAAVSPALIYYNRYFIHESIFVLFSLLFLYFLWRLVDEKTWRYAILTGVMAGLLHALRETVVLVLFAAAVAITVSQWQARKTFFAWLFSRDGLLRLAAGAGCGIVVSVFFYSAFFTYWQGPIDSILTYFNYSTEVGHEKPWYYYLLLIVGEKTPTAYFGQAWLLVFGAAGLWQAFGEKKTYAERIPFFRYVSAYTLATTIVYSLIAYKTPWLMLNFLIGWILLAGIGWVYLWAKYKSVILRSLLVLVLLGSLAHSVRQSWLLSFRFSADPRNPFVYSHTSPDLLKLVNRLELLASLHPDGKAMRIDIAGAEYWPLPWYLRDFSRVGYWSELVAGSDAPVQIVSFSGDQEVPELDPDRYTTDLRGLRDGVFLLTFIEKQLWERQFPNE
jgi:uncharacterized protein (TIGR03663 family)